MTDIRDSAAFACVAAPLVDVSCKPIRLLALALAALSIQTADAKSHVIRCTGLGSWSCSDDGICIDSTRIRGKIYNYDTKKMKYDGPNVSGSIIGRSVNQQGRLVLELDDQTRLTIDDHPSPFEPADRKRLRSVIRGGGYNTTELECR